MFFGNQFAVVFHEAAGHPVTLTETAFQKCISPSCGAVFEVDDVLVTCRECGELLDVGYDWNRSQPPDSLQQFENAWRTRTDPLLSLIHI